jgi:hypothetical protein
MGPICYAVSSPRKQAKASGTPQSLMITGLAASGRALRAKRLCQVRRHAPIPYGKATQKAQLGPLQAELVA